MDQEKPERTCGSAACTAVGRARQGPRRPRDACGALKRECPDKSCEIQHSCVWLVQFMPVSRTHDSCAQTTVEQTGHSALSLTEGRPGTAHYHYHYALADYRGRFPGMSQVHSTVAEHVGMSPAQQTNENSRKTEQGSESFKFNPQGSLVVHLILKLTIDTTQSHAAHDRSGSHAPWTQPNLCQRGPWYMPPQRPNPQTRAPTAPPPSAHAASSVGWRPLRNRARASSRRGHRAWRPWWRGGESRRRRPPRPPSPPPPR